MIGIKGKATDSQGSNADEYGMKKYVVSLLQRCPKHGLPKDKEAELMQAHQKKHHSAWK